MGVIPAFTAIPGDQVDVVAADVAKSILPVGAAACGILPFGLNAKKYAARSDAYGTAACLSRAINQLVLALFALNRTYPINDKTALAQAGESELAPRDFEPRVQKALAHLGTSAEELGTAVQSIAALHRETVELSEGLYQPFSLCRSEPLAWRL